MERDAEGNERTSAIERYCPRCGHLTDEYGNMRHTPAFTAAVMADFRSRAQASLTARDGGDRIRTDLPGEPRTYTPVAWDTEAGPDSFSSLDVNTVGDVPGVDAAALYQYLTQLSESYPASGGEASALRYARNQIQAAVREVAGGR